MNSTIKRSLTRRDALVRLALLYVHLWVLEGAVRKWLPGLDTVFYFARDGLLLAGLLAIFVWFGPPSGRRWLTAVFWLLVLLWLVLASLQVVFSDVPLLVAIAGLRSYLAPIVLPLILWRDGSGAFVERALRLIAFYAPFQAALTVVQVSSPRTAFINIQTGGEEAFFTTAGGVVRASGTFTAPAGMILFTTLALVAGISIISGQNGRRGVGWIALSSAVLIVVVGGSRGAVFAGAFILGAWFLYTLLSGKPKQYVLAIVAASVGFLAAALTVSALPAVYDAFVLRFINAAQDENTVDRLVRSVLGFGGHAVEVWGEGMGVYSNIGVALGSGRQWIEVESIRWVAELGILGYVMVVVRLVVAALILAWMLLIGRRFQMPAMLTAAAIVHTLLFGSLTTQPSNQGYVAVVAAIFIGSLVRSQASPESLPNSKRPIPTART